MPLAFFGSAPDIGIILVVALIIFGPKKLPEVGKQLGQAMREFRKMADELTGAVHSVRDDVESAYKPVLTSTLDHSTSSSTVEHAMSHRPFDSDAEDLMAPAVMPKSDPPALTLSTLPPGPPQAGADNAKGH